MPSDEHIHVTIHSARPVNAIERLRGLVRVSNPTPGEQDALAAVEALHQAAKDMVDVPDENYTLAAIRTREDTLAAAVRRIEGESTDEPPVSPFHTEPVPS